MPKCCAVSTFASVPKLPTSRCRSPSYRRSCSLTSASVAAGLPSISHIASTAVLIRCRKSSPPNSAI